ncbi:GUN4 domain-containing protein, partial [Moorena sp. SIO3I6]|uniref:GUN4 domain-containing protein n=1 Tax=Moorena sp. SIO3I6 TaxID=2607831 RepID=UPI0013F705F3
CVDLKIIDKLSGNYSEGKFGYRVQHEIYKSIDRNIAGNKIKNEKIIALFLLNFAERIGWLSHGKIKDDNQLIFNPVNAPKGHLPQGGHSSSTNKDISKSIYDFVKLINY